MERERERERALFFDSIQKNSSWITYFNWGML